VPVIYLIRSWAAWAGVLCAGGGLFAIYRGILSGRRPPYSPAGSTLPSGAWPEAIEGRSEAIVMLDSPATSRECVQYEEKIESAPLTGELADDEGRESTLSQVEDLLEFEIADRAVGAFLVASAAGKAIVWPGVGDVRYMDGWTKRENNAGDRESDERFLRAGMIVRVRGTPGTISQMMSEMVERAEDLPEDLLKALETRQDLSSLPCYWPRKGGKLWVEEEGAETDEGDEETGPIAHLVLAAVAFLLAGVLMFCAYKRIL
jgi:hypothetical protein